MTVFCVKMRNKSTGYVGNHSAWRNKADADRQAALRNNYHPDYTYWVIQETGVQGSCWWTDNLIKLPSSIGWMVVQK